MNYNKNDLVICTYQNNKQKVGRIILVNNSQFINWIVPKRDGQISISQLINNGISITIINDDRINYWY